MEHKQAQPIGRLAAVVLGLAAGPLWAGTEGTSSTFYGQGAGASGSSSSGNNTFVGYAAGTSSTGTDNTFVGYGAGYYNTIGNDNAFLGLHAGLFNTTGNYSTYLGADAGLNNTTGYHNTFVGYSAGYTNTTGHGNVFLGFGAGFTETGSNKLYIDNCLNSNPCTPPFIYGEFDNHLLKINGVTEVAANNVAKSQMHFSLANADSGGFLTSVLENNFFVSSGARYDATAGGWIQRSSDQQAVIAGSGGVGYRIFTDSGHAVGSNFTPTVRLHIDYSGNLGLNTPAVAGTPIMHSSGAHLTAGGVWTDASSREYKEHIAALSTADAMQTFAALAPVTYNYKVDPQEKHVGFIAEDVPPLVATKDRASLSPMDIVAVLTKVMQEQKRMLERQQMMLHDKTRALEQQQDELAQLRSQLRILARKIEQLDRR